MTNTQTPSGQRPPNANRPTDAKIAALLRDFAELRDDWSNGKSSDWDDYTEWLRTMADALEDQHRADYCADCDQPNRACTCAPPARLTPEQWQEAVTKGAAAMHDMILHHEDPHFSDAQTPELTRMAWKSRSECALRAAFPHLAPNPED